MSVVRRLQALGKNADRFLFAPLIDASTRRSLLYTVTVLLALYFAGIYHWLGLLSYETFTFRVLDWAWEHRFYSVVKEGISKLEIPYYTSFPYHGNDRFMSFPNVPASPQILLLAWLPIKDYLIFNTVLLYTVGFHGCFLIARRYSLSLSTFSLLLVLFNLNGHITTHIAVGHTQWYAYFFLPYFIYLVLQIRSDYFPRLSVLRLSLVLFCMVLQGGIHFFVPSLMFLFFTVLTNFSANSLLRFAQTCGISFLLGVYRFLPTVFYFGDTPRPFIPGYSSFIDIVEQMTILFPNYAGTRNPSTLWSGLVPRMLQWEYDIYIGATGFFFLALCGIYLRFRKASANAIPMFKNMDWPMVIMTWLSIGPNYYFVVAMGIPIVSTVERAPSRLIIYPLLILIVVASIRLQALLAAGIQRTTIKIVSLVGLIHIGFLLRLHAGNWRMEDLEASVERKRVQLHATMVMGDDVIYEQLVRISLLLSVCFVAWFVWLYRSTVRRESVGGGTSPE